MVQAEFGSIHVTILMCATHRKLWTQGSGWCGRRRRHQLVAGDLCCFLFSRAVHSHGLYLTLTRLLMHSADTISFCGSVTVGVPPMTKPSINALFRWRLALQPPCWPSATWGG